jgi:hypothetical protein
METVVKDPTTVIRWGCHTKARRVLDPDANNVA